MLNLGTYDRQRSSQPTTEPNSNQQNPWMHRSSDTHEYKNSRSSQHTIEAGSNQQNPWMHRSSDTHEYKNNNLISQQWSSDYQTQSYNPPNVLLHKISAIRNGRDKYMFISMMGGIPDII